MAALDIDSNFWIKDSHDFRFAWNCGPRRLADDSRTGKALKLLDMFAVSGFWASTFANANE
jgi:hypothetical protein